MLFPFILFYISVKEVNIFMGTGDWNQGSINQLHQYKYFVQDEKPPA